VATALAGAGAAGVAALVARGEPRPTAPVVPPVTVAVPGGGFFAAYSARAASLLRVALPEVARETGGRLRGQLVEPQLPPRAPGDDAASAPRQVDAVALLQAAGTPPDLLALAGWPNPGAVFQEFRAAVRTGWLAPLDAPLRQHRGLALGEFLPPALAICRHRGALLGVPLLASPALLVYDPALLAAAGMAPPAPGPGWGWGEVLEALDRLGRTDAAGAPTQHGFFPGFATSGLLALLWQHGADVVSAGGRRSGLQEPAAREAAAFFAELYRRRPGAFPLPPSPPGADIPNGPGFRWNWRGGMRVTGGPALASLLQGLEDFAALKPGPLAAAPPPAGRHRAAPLGVVATLSLNARARDPDRAAAALAALAERATRVHALDLAPRRQPAALVESYLTAGIGLDPALDTGQTVTDALGSGRALVLDDVDRTEQLHGALGSLVQAVQRQPDAVATALEAAHAGAGGARRAAVRAPPNA
jgi:ABC-type glycerol-3-phosphate transport system substrate-binding protein